MRTSDLIFLLPEIILSIGSCALLLAPVSGFRSSSGTARSAMLALLALAAVSVIFCSNAVQPLAQSVSFGRMFALDGFAIFFKLLFIASIALVTLLSSDFLKEANYSAWEYYALLAFALTGMSFMVSGVHLVSIYIGLELLSLPSYILAGYYKHQNKSTEAGMKYFVLGAVSSAILLYGMSLIYGVCGSFQLAAIREYMANVVTNDALVFGIILMAAGLCFKIAAVPFHVWTPDVYEGAPTPIAAFLSTASKAAAFAIFTRIFFAGLADFQIDWSNLLATVSALSMVIGNLAAITQTNIKRMLAYSSISHAGYGLMGIIALNETGLEGILVYTLVYVFANIGIWATVLILRRREYAGERIEDFEGLHHRAPFWAFSMVVFLLSLGGIPPTAGFIGKYYLFAAAVRSGFGWLAILAVLMSALSMFYYLRVVVAMYLREGSTGEFAPTPSLSACVWICLAVTLVLGVLPQPLLVQVRDSSRTVLGLVGR